MNSLIPYDAYTLINDIVKLATGRDDLKAVDTSSFVTVGETILRTGTENTLNAISTMVGKTIFSARPYKSKLSSLQVSEERWGLQVRKITPLRVGPEASQNWNTQQSPNQLADGQSVDMFTINKPKAVQLNFYGTKTLQRHITRFRDQLSPAFRNEAEFMAFWDAVMVEFNNETELENEAKTRATLLNYIAGISSMGLYEVDLVKEYNDTFGTNYTRSQLLTSQLTSFMQFVAAQIPIYSDKLTDMSVIYHANITGYDKIGRHTPKNRQKMIMYNPFFKTAQAQVFSSIFNPDYLNIGDFEGVNYWQSQTNPLEISVTPNILNTATGSSQTAAAQVNLPYVLGLLYDEEAVGVMPQFSYASTTPFNSAGEYYNMFMHWRFNAYNDFTENGILFVLGEGGEDTPVTPTTQSTEAAIAVKTTAKAAKAAKATT